jgi:spermidine/putrescine ABC transporter ATP-binding subunit
METEYSVELRDIVKKFSDFTAVDHVNLRVEKGKVFSLLGPSGCGKSTTLRIVAGLETADDGNILIGGQIVDHVPPYKRECNMVFQNLAVFPHMSVEKNIAYGLERRNTPKAKIRSRVSEMLDLMGLLNMEKRFPAQLSGGQQQRVALARSLVLNPKLLLLDEPLAALDRKLRKEMTIEIKRIQREVGITFLYVTHDQKVALSISDTIAVMKDGKLEQVGPPNEIYETPKTGFVADFMGAANILYGKATSQNDDQIQLETDSGLLLNVLTKNGTELKDIAGVSVHPEFVGVVPVAKDVKADNKFRGKVIDVVYQGDFVEVLISLDHGGATLMSHVSSKFYQKYGFAANDDVLVHWNARRNNLLLAK